MARRILIVGDSKSGKSHYSLELARTFSYPVFYLATADLNDENLQEPIRKQKKDRWHEIETIEETIYIAQKIKENEDVDKVMVIDCLTLWMENLSRLMGEGSKSIEEQIQIFFQALEGTSLNMILVIHSSGMEKRSFLQMAKVPANELVNFNQEVALRCDEIIFMEKGYPMTIKRVRMDEF